MRIGNIGSGNIGATAALIEEIGFAPVDTGSLGKGGRRQQPGSPIYANQITAREAEEVLA